MSYGIIKDGALQPSPHRIILSDMQIWNPSDEQLKQAGYKEIVEIPMPEDAPEGQYYESHYEDKGDHIETVWNLVDDPEPEPEISTLESRVSALEENQSQMDAIFEEVVNGEAGVF